MITLRPAAERGHFDHGWLDTNHTFSFGHYLDPAHMGFRHLRVMNEDRVAPRQGFGTHGHSDMEIISYVVEGALAHEDSMGSRSELEPGDIQVMSAGRGITHSEFNGSDSDPVHFLQIWIEPRERGLDPRYGEKHFGKDVRRNRLQPVASPDGRDGSLPIAQDVTVHAGLLDAGQKLSYDFAPGRHGWIQLVRGRIQVRDADSSVKELTAGDGAAISDESRVELTASEDAELLFFDLA